MRLLDKEEMRERAITWVRLDVEVAAREEVDGRSEWEGVRYVSESVSMMRLGISRGKDNLPSHW